MDSWNLCGLISRKNLLMISGRSSITRGYRMIVRMSREIRKQSKRQRKMQSQSRSTRPRFSPGRK